MECNARYAALAPTPVDPVSMVNSSGKCIFAPGEAPEDAQSRLHEANVAMAAASTWCQERHSDTSWLLLWPRLFRRLNVWPQTPSVTCPGYPSAAPGSTRIHVIHRTLRYLAGLGWLLAAPAAWQRAMAEWLTACATPWCLPFPLRQPLCTLHTRVLGLHGATPPM